ncbi:hypothetical protein NRK67_16945 (plasmid) [Fusobacteria bacterium ZRK30]|nr:hypothetical protein NRK67_16945 [Fusobacteria bacterium ZRK30]
MKKIKSFEKVEVERIHNLLLNDILSVSSDLMYLSQNFQLNKYLRGQIKDLNNIEEDFLSFSKNKKLYNKIRYIDENGMEKIRINYNNGNPYVVKRENLQNKVNRYYFKNTISLDKKGIFLSKFDLNMENSKVELPYNSTLRFATPIFDQDGSKKGIVIINYFGKRLLNSINKGLKNQDGSPTLSIDDHSYYLKSTEKHKEWGIMLEEKQDLNFKDNSLEIWKQVKKK